MKIFFQDDKNALVLKYYVERRLRTLMYDNDNAAFLSALFLDPSCKENLEISDQAKVIAYLKNVFLKIQRLNKTLLPVKSLPTVNQPSTSSSSLKNTSLPIGTSIHIIFNWIPNFLQDRYISMLF